MSLGPQALWTIFSNISGLQPMYYIISVVTFASFALKVQKKIMRVKFGQICLGKTFNKEIEKNRIFFYFFLKRLILKICSS